MKKDTIRRTESSRVKYEELENYVRMKAQGFIQDVLEEEMDIFLGRSRYERKKKGIDIPEGYRNGHGKPRKFILMNGTITVRRPRVRNTDEKFESQVLPLFKRRSKELGAVLPNFLCQNAKIIQTWDNA